MFDELPVLMVATGTQHVVVLTADSQDHQQFPLFTEEVLNFKMVQKQPKPKDNQEEEKHHVEEVIPVIIHDATLKRNRAEFEQNIVEEPVVEPKQPEVKRRKVMAKTVPKPRSISSVAVKANAPEKTEKLAAEPIKVAKKAEVVPAKISADAKSRPKSKEVKAKK